MPDISTDSSFERISDSDHSEVRRKKKPTDAVQSSDDSDGDLLHSANDSNALPCEEAKKKLHKQKLTDAEAKGFSKGLLTAGFMLVTGFFVFGAGVLIFERPCVRNNASSIVQKINVTMENPENVDKFSKEKKQKFLDDVAIEKEEFNKFLKISESRKIIQGVTKICKFPAYLWNKFIPDYSRFDGVDEFLQQTKTNGTIVDDYLHHTTPRFRIDDEGNEWIHFVIMNTLEKIEKFKIQDCEKSSRKCHSYYWFMKNGNLYINEKFVLNAKEYTFTRVYFIPPHEMI